MLIFLCVLLHTCIDFHIHCGVAVACALSKHYNKGRGGHVVISKFIRQNVACPTSFKRLYRASYVKEVISRLVWMRFNSNFTLNE